MTTLTEDCVTQWWADWRARDFSWDGLARDDPERPGLNEKLWQGWWIDGNGQVTPNEDQGVRPANLQDYWRRGPSPAPDAGSLSDAELDLAMEIAGTLVRDPDGALWHLAHVPPSWGDGSASWKNAARRDTPLRERLERSSELKSGSDELKSVIQDHIDWADAMLDSRSDLDCRAQLMGTNLVGIPSQGINKDISTSADFSWCCFLGATVFRANLGSETPTFADGTQFLNALFDSQVDFDRAAFQGEAVFSDAIFLGVTSFRGTRFLTGARFVDATFFGRAVFEYAAFGAGASFGNARFFDDTSFHTATFLADAMFDRASFASNATFIDATFQGELFLYGCNFSNSALFTRTNFERGAYFEDATFGGHAKFQDAAFWKEAAFKASTFLRSADFFGATFAGATDFSAVIFLDDASFAGEPRDLTKKPADQIITVGPNSDGIGWSGELGSHGGPTDRGRRSVKSLSATNAVFAADVDFSNRDFLSKGDFKGARFLGKVTFHGAILHQDVSFQGAAFEGALSPLTPLPTLDYVQSSQLKLAASAMSLNDDGVLNGPPDWHGSWRAARLAKFQSTDQRFEDLERSYRTLKQAMEAVRHRNEEARFFKLELQARRKRHDIPGWERWASYAYEVLSDYGGSVSRPLTWLLILWISCATFVGFQVDRVCTHHVLTSNTSDILNAACPHEVTLERNMLQAGFEALTFSGANMVPLPKALSGETVHEDAAARVLTQYANPGWRFALALVTTFQTLLSLALIFLTGLALRRRFQIS